MHNSGLSSILAAASMLPLVSCMLEPATPAPDESSDIVTGESTFALTANKRVQDLGGDSPAVQTIVIQNFINGHFPGRCLDAATQSLNRNGTKMQLWDCSSGNQQFWESPLSGRGTIKNIQSGRCLDAELQSIGRDGTKVQLWDCNGGSQQLWDITGPGTIRNVHSGRCLDAALQSIDRNGTTIQLWACNGGSQQFWF